MRNFKKIIVELTRLGETIATMESCTGGAVSSAITSIEGASDVLKFSAVTYSNEYKIKMGVNPEVIDKYSVYSIQTAHEMALNIARFAQADIGVGITGKLNRADKSNNFGKDNEVFVSIYYKDKYYDLDLCVSEENRTKNKQVVVDNIIAKIEEVLYEEDK